jgi:hypothetical protein
MSLETPGRPIDASHLLEGPTGPSGRPIDASHLLNETSGTTPSHLPEEPPRAPASEPDHSDVKKNQDGEIESSLNLFTMNQSIVSNRGFIDLGSDVPVNSGYSGSGPNSGSMSSQSVNDRRLSTSSMASAGSYRNIHQEQSSIPSPMLTPSMSGSHRIPAMNDGFRLSSRSGLILPSYTKGFISLIRKREFVTSKTNIYRLDIFEQHVTYTSPNKLWVLDACEKGSEIIFVIEFPTADPERYSKIKFDEFSGKLSNQFKKRFESFTDTNCFFGSKEEMVNTIISIRSEYT